MAEAFSKFEAQYETQDAIRQVVNLGSALDDHVQKLIAVVVETDKMNAKEKLTSKTIKSLTEDMDKYTATLKATKEGSRVASVTIDKTRSVMEKLRNEAFQTAKSLTAAFSGQFANKVKPEQLLSLTNAVATAKVDGARLQEIFSNVQKGITGNLKATEVAVFKSLQNIVRAQEEAVRKASALRIARRTTGTLGLTGVSPVEQLNLTKTVADAGLSSKRLQTIFTNLKSGVVSDIRETEIAVVKSLSRIIKAEQDASAQSARLLNAKSITDNLRKTLQPRDFGRNIDPSRVAKFNTELLNLQSVVAKAGTSATRVTQLYNDLKKNVLSATNQTEIGVTKALSRVIRAHQETGKEVSSFTRGFLVSWQSIGRLAAIQLLHRGVSTLIVEFREAAKAALDLANEINLIQTITLRTAESSEKWLEAIRRTSDIFGTNINDTAIAFYEAVSNQISETTDDTERFVSTVLKLAKVTQSSAKDAGEIVAGVINAYGLAATQAERVSAVLFKAVDLGSFTLTDLSQRLGRVNTIANQLGLTFEEVSGILATFSREGRRADASITILRALLQKINKPTETMAALLKEWGFNSGQAALRTLGFTEVIKRFSNILKTQGAGAISKYFDELRGFEAILAAAGTSFEGLLATLKEVDDAQRDFAKAVDLVNTTPIRQLQIELNKIHNILTVDLATAALNFFADLNKNLDGLSNRFKVLINALSSTGLQAIIKSFAEMVTTVTSASTAFDLLTRSVVVIVEALGSLKLLLFVGVPGAIAKIIAGLVALIGVFNQLRGALTLHITDAVAKFVRENQQITDAAINESNRLTDEQTKATGESITKTRKLVLLYLSDRLKASNLEKEVIKSDAKEVEAFIESSLKNRIQRFKDFIQELSKEIKSNQTEIGKNEQKIRDILSKRDADQFNFGNQFKNDAEQLQALIAKAQEFKLQIFNTDSVKDAENIAKNAIDIIDDIQKKQEQRREKALEKGQLGTVVKANEALIKLQEQRRDIQDELISRIERENDLIIDQTNLLEKQKAADSQTFGEIKATIREILKIKLLNQEGGLNFKDATTAFDKVNALVGRVDELLSKNEGNLERFPELAALRKDIGTDVDELGNVINLQQETAKLITDIFSRFGAAENNVPVEILEKLKELGITGTNISELSISADNLFKVIEKSFSDLVANLKDSRKKDIENKATVDGIQRQLLSLLDGFTVKQDAGDTPFKDLIKEVSINNNLDKVASALERAIQDGIFKTGRLKLDINPEEIVTKAIEKLRGIETQKGQTSKLETQFEALKEIIGKHGSINDILIDQVQINIDSLDINTDALEANTDALSELRKALNQRGVVPGFAKGGFVGTDTIMARLTPGEFVMNRDATRQFLPQLQALNDLELGGVGTSTNTVNLGGLSITVAGNENPTLTARAIVSEINKAVNAGQIKLSRGRV